ncbi:S1C family serine protease [Hwanghaeella sp.]|uniref:S1C family serine protease n=1 Tax=Hwanghaeella sp. TaxID=2605943 RepID=UPI003CCBDCA5
MRRAVCNAVTVCLVLAVVGVCPAVAEDRVSTVDNALQSVVSVLPLWPGLPQGGGPDVPAGSAPEGTGVVLDASGHIATALHVVERSLSVSVRLPDGRILPAAIVAGDLATDIAVLRVDAVLPPFEAGADPRVGQSVCAIGNAFGFDLSLSCGVVSAVRRTGMGFNAIEDFVQTDAAMNPGASGGALIDDQGRLVGMLSAIITKDSDADAGFNLAVSHQLLRRVTTDLIAVGKVVRSVSGVGFAGLTLQDRRDGSGVLVRAVRPGSGGAASGLLPGDVIRQIDGRRMDRPTDAMTALFLRRPGDGAEMDFLRDGVEMTTRLVLDGMPQ